MKKMDVIVDIKVNNEYKKSLVVPFAWKKMRNHRSFEPTKDAHYLLNQLGCWEIRRFDEVWKKAQTL